MIVAKYIDREALIEWLKRIPLIDLSDGRGLCRVIMEDAFKKAIKKMPKGIIVDVAPVRHGRWISLTECANEGVYCSICKKKVWKSDYAWCSKSSRNKLRSNYCPNCGAKMDGGADIKASFGDAPEDVGYQLIKE